MFFQPERMLAAWELTIWAIQRTTMSLMVGDLNRRWETRGGGSGRKFLKMILDLEMLLNLFIEANKLLIISPNTFF